MSKQVWFTSDQHFYHANVVKYCNRPYTRHLNELHKTMLGQQGTLETREAIQRDVEEMNEDLITRFNALVGPEDVIYHLGDFSMAFRPVEVFLPRLNGFEHHLIMGNHDFAHPGHKKGRKQPEIWKQKYLDAGFKSVSLHMDMEIDGKTVHLSHMPYRNLEPGEHGEKFTEFRLENDGKILLHGHVHQNWLKRGNMINVGVDVNGMAPISLDRVIELMKIEGDL